MSLLLAEFCARPVVIFRRLESLCKEQAAGSCLGTTVAQAPAVNKQSSTFKARQPIKLVMPATICTYEPLLDQCEATASQNELKLDCCATKQLRNTIAPTDWNSPEYELASVQELVNALTLDHAFVTCVINDVTELFDVVSERHGDDYPDLEHLSTLFTFLADELQPLMLREERVFFPLVMRLEKAAEFGLSSLLSPFAGLDNPIRSTTLEHETVRGLLNDLRDAMSNYEVPVGACSGHALIYSTLRILDEKVEQHFAVEERVVYPRAIEMEARINVHG